MATREQIREGLKRVLTFIRDVEDKPPVDEDVEWVMNCLDSWGTVIRTDGELPDNKAWHKIEREYEAYCAGKNDMLRWHEDSLEPLIKEE